MTILNESRQFSQNFIILSLEEITENISYEHSVYESVEDRSFSYRLYLENQWNPELGVLRVNRNTAFTGQWRNV